MISYISGTVLKTSFSKNPYIDILVNNGMGYRIHVPSTYILPNKGEKYSLFTYLYIREDKQTLYGFQKEEEKELFEQLISVSGIGPRIGIAVLSTYTQKETEKIILKGDAKALSKVSGLGSKGAQKIILELRGKVDFNQKEESVGVIKELKEALKSLGFGGELLKEKIQRAEKVLSKKKNISIEDLLKEVLSK